MSCKIRRPKKLDTTENVIDENIVQTLTSVYNVPALLTRYLRYKLYDLFSNNKNLLVSINNIDACFISELLQRQTTGFIVESYILSLLNSVKLLLNITKIEQTSQVNDEKTFDIIITPNKTANHIKKSRIYQLQLPDEIILEVKTYKNGKISNPRITNKQKQKIQQNKLFILLVDYTINGINIIILHIYAVSGNNIVISNKNRITKVNINELNKIY